MRGPEAIRKRRTRLAVALGLAVAVGGVVAATAGTGVSAAASSSNGIAAPIAPKVCGKPVTYANDPNGLLKALPAAARTAYAEYPYDVRATPWSSFKGKKGPWKIGYISFPADNAWKINFGVELQKEFAAAKAKGLVTGSLQTYIQPASSTATPEQQDAAIQQMVRDGVDGILLAPLDTNAETPAIDAAGKAGVPVVIIGDVAANSKYAINVFGNNSAPARAGLLALLVKKGVIGPGKTTNLLVIRGLPGVAVEVAQWEGGTYAIKPCPGVKIVGTVWGQWNPAVQKTQILSFVASHPGLKINLVFTDGGFGGVIEAFQELGLPVPPTNSSGASGGDLSWWYAHRSTYQTVGSQFGGAATAWTEFRILLRVLAGKEPRLRDFEIAPATVTNSNLGEYAPKGKPVTFIGDTTMPVTAWANNTTLNEYFKQPGGPDGF
jgi:ribose transport system substrate-binding protein